MNKGLITDYNTLEPTPSTYGVDYSRVYLKTLMLAYTKLKNAFLANQLCYHVPAGGVAVDIGGNINALRKGPGIRNQLDQRGFRDDYYALDINPAFFNIGGALLTEPADSKEYYSKGQRKGIVADAYCLPFAPRTLDTVILADVLEHLQNPRQIVAAIAEALKIDGQLFLVLPAMYKLDQFDLDEIHRARKTNHINFFNEEQIRGMLSTCGLHVEDMQGLNYADSLTFMLWSDTRYVTRDQKERTLQEERFQKIRSLLTTFDREGVDRQIKSNPVKFYEFRSSFFCHKTNPIMAIAEITKFDPNFQDDPSRQEAYHKICSILTCAEEDSRFNLDWMRLIMAMPNPAFLANSVYIRARKNVKSLATLGS